MGELAERRTTLDLVQELEQESRKFWQCCLVVCFEKETKLVFASDADRLDSLDQMVEAGGTPVGLIAARTEGNELVIATRPLREFEDEAQVREYLREYAGVIGATLQDREDQN